MNKLSGLRPSLAAFFAILFFVSLAANAKAGEAEMIADVTSLTPGGSVTIAFRPIIRSDESYGFWEAGLSGMPISLNVRDGITRTATYFPQLTKSGTSPRYSFAADDYMARTYQMPEDLGSDEEITFDLYFSAAICRDICEVENYSAQLSLPVGDGAAHTANAARIEAIREGALEFRRGRAASRAGEGVLSFGVNLRDQWLGTIASGRFLPLTSGLVAAGSRQDFELRARGLFMLDELAPGAPEVERIEGLLVLADANGEPVLVQYVNEPNSYNNIDLNAGVTVKGSGDARDLTLLTAALFALVGGLILNIMPCVFPVLAMKAMSLINLSTADEKTARREALSYTAGILTSFLALGFVVLIVQSGGQSVGWGFQLQSEGFVIFMAVVLFAMGLNFLGVFEFSGRFADIGQSLANQQGKKGAYFTGVLAAIVATPCTAPFMAPAVSFALLQTGPVVLTIFAFLGLGLALPFLIVSYIPQIRARLPRPGAWMATFKEFLAFPMFATVIWLLWVLSEQTDSPSPLLALSSIFLMGFGAWIYVRTDIAQRIAKNVLAPAILTLGLIAVPLNQTLSTTINSRDGMEYVGNIEMVPYSAEEINRLRAEGRPVFLHFWAAWCIYCLMHESLVFSTDDFADYIEENNIVFMKLDNTLEDAGNMALMQSFGRTGQPLDVYFPASLSKSAVVLPELFTVETVIGHMEAGAAGE
jgi:thiol:disulfide interchange protein